MPRKTRAAARAEEDIDIAIDASAEIEQNSSIESQKGLSIKGPERQPLQEVEVNASEAVAQHEQAIENETIPDSENNGGTKKDKGGKSTFKKKSGKKDGKGKKDNTAKRDEAASEARVQDQVAEDESASQTSSASQVAAEELRDMSQSDYDIVEDKSKTGVSPAVEQTCAQLSEAGKNSPEEACPNTKPRRGQERLAAGGLASKTKTKNKKTQGQAQTCAAAETVCPGLSMSMKPNTEVQGDDRSIQQGTKSEQATTEELSAANASHFAEGTVPEGSPRPEAVQKLVGLFEEAAEAKQETTMPEDAGKIVETAPEKIDEHAEGTVDQAHASESPEGKRFEAANPSLSPSESKNSKADVRKPREALRKSQPGSTSNTHKASATKKTSPKPSIPSNKGTAPRKSIAPLRANTSSLGARKSLAIRDTTNKHSPIEEKASKSPKTAVPEKRTRAVIAALSTPPPLAKSTKPVTKPTFQLPGEAVTAKLKAQREERLKRQEEEENNKKNGASTGEPAPKSAKPLVGVRQTATSRMRSSIGGKEGGDKAATIRSINKRVTSVYPRASTAPRGSRPSTLGMKQGAEGASNSPSDTKASGDTIRHERPSTSNARPKVPSAANSIQPRAPTSALRRVSTTTKPAASASSIDPSAASAAPRAKLTSIDMATQRMKGKEIFAREKREKAQREKEQQDKYDAAKKARAEAAERGRQASREWAERMKKKALEEKARKVEGGEGKENEVPLEGLA